MGTGWGFRSQSNDEKYRSHRFTLAILIVAAATMVGGLTFAQDQPTPTPVPSPTAEQLAAGKADFIKHCAPCHSENGKGNGPEVKMIPGIKPADLTKIAMSNGGVFPFQSVEDTIDGRKAIPSHKRFDMPFWGVNFQQEGSEFTSASEAKAKARIDAIVFYIEELQVK